MTCSRKVVQQYPNGSTDCDFVNDFTGASIGYRSPCYALQTSVPSEAVARGACDAPCAPAWVCELPLNGYEKDGCGNRRLNTACNPPTISPLQPCPEGTTRQVKCPKDLTKIVTQRCVNGAWVTLPADEKACEKTDPAKMIIAAVIIAIILIFLGSKAVK